MIQFIEETWQSTAHPSEQKLNRSEFVELYITVCHVMILVKSRLAEIHLVQKRHKNPVNININSTLMQLSDVNMIYLF